MQAISPLFGMKMSVGNDISATCVGNAAVAMSHMIMESPNDVPLTTVPPVILKILTLKNNMTVNETVYKCLLGFMGMNNAKALLCHCTYLITSE